MKTLKKNRAYFEVLRDAKPTLGKAIICHLDKQLINCFRLVCYNILRGNLKLKPRDQTKLRPYRNTLHRLVKSKPDAARRMLVNQKGEFLGTIIPAIIAGVSALFGGK